MASKNLVVSTLIFRTKCLLMNVYDGSSYGQENFDVLVKIRYQQKEVENLDNIAKPHQLMKTFYVLKQSLGYNGR